MVCRAENGPRRHKNENDSTWFGDGLGARFVRVRVHDLATAPASASAASSQRCGEYLNPWLVRIAVALFLPAIAFSWRHSRLVALAVAIPFVANVVEMSTGPSLPPDHPARVIVPLVSSALGFVAATREGRDGRRVSTAFALGAITAALGVTDIIAVFYFKVRSEWYPVWMNAAACLAFVLISKRRLSWLTLSSP